MNNNTQIVPQFMRNECCIFAYFLAPLVCTFVRAFLVSAIDKCASNSFFSSLVRVGVAGHWFVQLGLGQHGGNWTESIVVTWLTTIALGPLGSHVTVCWQLGDPATILTLLVTVTHWPQHATPSPNGISKWRPNSVRASTWGCCRATKLGQPKSASNKMVRRIDSSYDNIQ